MKMIVDSLDDSLLKKEYLGIKNNNLTGHCYVATEVLYHLLEENEQKNYTPAILKVNDITHWFLKNKNTNEIIDITKDQFNFELDYTKSRNCFFLTKTPSKRALILINRIYEKNNN